MTADAAEAPVAEPDRDDLAVVPVRHPGRWVAVAVIAVIAAMVVNWLIRNPRWEWSYIQGYLTYRTILSGLGITLALTALAMLMGVLLGIVVAVMRLSKNPIVSGAAWFYTWFFRGAPVIVQLFFWINLAALVPTVSFGIPFGPGWGDFDTNRLLPVFVAALLGLGLNEAAYMAEIVRAGILSVDQGQTEASQALGMRSLQIMRRVVLPQAMRVIVPPTGNETISMLKTSALVAFIGVYDLLGAAQAISGNNYKIIPLLVVATIWYLVLTSLLGVGQYYIERYYARGSSRELPPTPVQRIKRTLAIRSKA